MQIRRATEDDLSDIGRIFDRSSAWLTEKYRPDQVGSPPAAVANREGLYLHLLSTGGMFVAADPDPVGFSAAVVRDGVWFLSLLWVLPERHGSGIGSALLQETLAWGRGSAVFSVVASPYPVAQLIYLRSSMYPLYVQVDMAGNMPRSEPIEGVDTLETSDQSWVDDLDREVRGIARPEDHEFWRREALGLALRRDGSPAGYIYGWPDGKVGPGVAREPADVSRLLAAAGRVLPENGRVTVALPSANWTALRELVRMGFAPIGSNTFMASRPLGDPTRYISSGGALA
ncbi:MAG: GNAT family N-acetyltransferase [Actinomycetota bacterium]